MLWSETRETLQFIEEIISALGKRIVGCRRTSRCMLLNESIIKRRLEEETWIDCDEWRS